MWHSLRGQTGSIIRCLFHMQKFNACEFSAVAGRLSAIPGRSKAELLESYQAWRVETALLPKVSDACSVAPPEPMPFRPGSACDHDFGCTLPSSTICNPPS